MVAVRDAVPAAVPTVGSAADADTDASRIAAEKPT
jgi:hypothetical protein